MNGRENIRYSIKLKLFIILITTIIFISTIFGFFFATMTKNGLIQEIEKRGRSEALNLAHDAVYGIHTEDKVELNHLVAGRMRKPDIIYIIIAMGSGRTLVDNRSGEFILVNTENKINNFDEVKGMHDLNKPFVSKSENVTRKMLVSDNGEKFYEYTAQTRNKDSESEFERGISEDLSLFSNDSKKAETSPAKLGFVKIGISLKRIESEIIKTLSIIIIVIVVITIIAIFASCYFVSRITKPIREIADTADEISKGDLSKRVEVKSMDEIGLMANNFNTMTSKLNSTITELEQFKVLLEKKVKQRTSDLESSNKELEKANKELKTLDDMKNKFIYTVSHDFRTPLTAIVGYAMTMRSSIQEEITDKLGDPNTGAVFGCQIMDEINDTQTGLEIIIKESERLTRLINSMLDLARIESGKDSWQDEPVNLLDITNLTKNSMQPLLREKNLSFNIDVINASPVVFCDRDRLTQVFVNLISNAIKFSDNGGVINCLITKNCKNFEIKVMDTGMGIPNDKLPYIFNKFSQADNNASNKHNGTGLGLTICREIISHFNGEIWVESELGKGSRFTFTIPVFDGSKTV